MTRTSVLSLRPAMALAVALAALAALVVTAAPADAGDDNSLTINPALRNIGAGGSGSVELVSHAPPASLAAWVIFVAFDPAVVAFDSCTAITLPAGSLGVTQCEAKDTGGTPDDDTVAVLGAVIFGDTERGLDGDNVLGTMEFTAVGAVGDCSDVTIAVAPENHLAPDTEPTSPTVINGEICITPGASLLWGDFDCGGSVDPIDSLKLLRFDAGLDVAQEEDCPAPGANVSVNGTQRVWGDLDCAGSADPIDSLKTLRFDAGLSVVQTGDCPGPASEVVVA